MGFDIKPSPEDRKQSDAIAGATFGGAPQRYVNVGL